MGIKTLPRRTPGDSSCSVRASRPPAFLPASQGQRKLARGRFGCQHPQLFQRRRPLTPPGGGCTSWAQGRRTLPLALPSLGPQEGDGAAQGPSGWKGRAWARAFGNMLARNYIRLEVSIFCSILLPDLIVHLWQCLYTSRSGQLGCRSNRCAPTL